MSVLEWDQSRSLSYHESDVHWQAVPVGENNQRQENPSQVQGVSLLEFEWVGNPNPSRSLSPERPVAAATVVGEEIVGWEDGQSGDSLAWQNLVKLQSTHKVLAFICFGVAAHQGHGQGQPTGLNISKFQIVPFVYNTI